jgi:hypothetical protein
MPDEAKWKRFEKKAFDIQKSISAANTDIKFNDSIPGMDSKTNRQIDISIRTKVGSYPILVIVECKDYKDPVDVKAVEAFVSVVRDVRANKGAMISAKGFTEAARTLAEHHNIDILRLIDTESVDWQTDVFLPSLLERTLISAYSLEFRNFMQIPIQPQMQMALELVTEKGEKLGTIQSILHQKWDSGAIPRAAGTHRIVIGTNLHNEFKGTKQTMDVEAHVRVEKRYYVGPIPIHFEGFLNIKSGGILTRQIKTGMISPFEIETGKVSGWKQIDDPSQVSPPPVIRIGYADTYAVGSEWVSGTGTVWPEGESKPTVE